MDPCTRCNGSGTDPGTSQTWHCYIEQYESVQSVNIMASTAIRAAVEAARTTGIAGRWTVTQGATVEVGIAQKVDYVAEVPEPAGLVTLTGPL